MFDTNEQATFLAKTPIFHKKALSRDKAAAPPSFSGVFQKRKFFLFLSRIGELETSFSFFVRLDLQSSRREYKDL